MNNWEILGINPTTDEEEIRKAYMMQLGQHHPEEDPEGFARLRSAYEEILRNLQDVDQDVDKEEEEDNSPTGMWMKRVAQCYEDFAMRISEEAWKELLADEVCYQLDEAETASKKLLVYLMDHFRLPHKIWKMFDDLFHWEANQEELYDIFPQLFIHFVRNSIASKKDNIEMDLIEVGLGVSWDEVDEWMEKYLYLDRYYQIDDFENLKITLDEMKGYDITHPQVELIEIYYLAHQGQVEEAVERGKAFIQAHEDYKPAYYPIGEVLLNAGEVEDGLKYLNKCLENDPIHYYANLELLKYYIDEPDKILEIEKYVKGFNQNFSGDEQAKAYTLKAQEQLVLYYEENVDLEDEEAKYRLAGYYFNLSNMDKCEELCKEILERNPEFSKAYHLLASIYVSKNEFEVALEYNTKWIEHIKEENLEDVAGASQIDDRASKTNVKVKDYAMAYIKRGLIYNYLERYEEAIADYDRALEYELDDLTDYIATYIKKCYCLKALNRYEEIIQVAQKLLDEGYKQTSVIYYYLAYAYCELGEYSKAMQACMETLRLDAYEIGAYQIQAKIYYEVRQYEDVLIVIERAQKYGFSEDEELMYYKIQALRATEEFEQAEEVCKRAIELYKENDKFYYSYALIKDRYEDYEEANQLLDESIRLKPSALKYYFRGNLYWSLDDYQKSIEAFTHALEEGKKDEASPEFMADTLDNMGRVYIRLNDLEHAKMCYEQAINYNPGHRRAYTDLAEYYEKMQDYYKAIENYTKQIEVTDEEYDYVGRGWCYIYLKEYETARADFESALKINPENAYAMNGIGSIYSRQDDDEKAIEYYQKGIETDENCIIAYENLGDALVRLRRNEEAIELYIKAIKQFPEHEYFYIDKGNAYGRIGKYEEAVKEYELAEAIDDQNYYIYYYKATAYKHMNQLKEALQCYKRVLQLKQDHVDSLWNMSEIYDDLGECQESIKCHQRIVEIEPDNSRSFCALGYYYRNIDDLDKSLEMYQKGLSLEPGYVVAMYGVANAYMDLKQYDSAIEGFKKTIEQHPDYLLTYRRISICYENIGQRDKAVLYLKKGLKVDANNIDILIMLGFCYYNLHDYVQAGKCFKKIIEIDENYDNAYRGIGLIYKVRGDYETSYRYACKAILVSALDYVFWEDINDLVLKYIPKYDETIELYSKLFEENNKPPRMGLFIGYIYKAKGEQKAADDYFKMAIEAFMSDINNNIADACTYFYIGECYRGMEDLENAARFYMQAILRGARCKECNRKGCYEAHFALGGIYESQEKYDIALEQYSKANEIDEDDKHEAAIKRMQEKLGKPQKEKSGLGKLLSRIPFLKR